MASPRVRQILLEILTDPLGQISTADQVWVRLCVAAVAALPIDGVGVASMTPSGHGGLLGASDVSATAMEDLQLATERGHVWKPRHHGRRPPCLPALAAVPRLIAGALPMIVSAFYVF